MRFSVPYGKGSVSFETPVPCRVLENPGFRAGDSHGIMAGAVDRPVGNTDGFSDFVKGTRKLLFILCDGTRPTPTALALEHLHPYFKGHGDVGFIIATGAHKEPTEDELETIFGRFLEEFRGRIRVHDARRGAHKALGRTSRGTPVAFDAEVMEADGIVTINSVEPHYFAGFTGGRKSFLPGVAAYESIEKNHSLVMEPGSRPMCLRGNPVSEDMEEALGFIKDKRIFSVQTVMLPDGALFSAYAGDMAEAFRLAVADSERIFSVGVKGKSNIVIAVAPPPMDRDLYQSQKALEHGRLALEDGGIMVLVSSCWDGIGDRGFYELLAKLKRDDDVLNHLGKNYRLGNHKAARWLDLCSKCKLWCVTGLGKDVLDTTRMRNFGSLQHAVDAAIAETDRLGKKAEMTLIPGASFTVPREVGQ